MSRANGIRERSPGVFELRVLVGRDADGRQITRSRTYRGTKQGAVKARAALLTEVERERAERPTAGTFRDLAERWYAYASPGLKARTALDYRGRLDRRILPAIGDLRLDKVTPAALDAMYASMQSDGLSAASVRRYHAVVRRVLNQGIKWGEVASNAASRATPPREHRREIEPPSAEVAKVLLAKAGPKGSFGVLVWLAAATGMRVGELCGLRWSRVSMTGELVVDAAVVQLPGERRVEAPKSHRRRTIALDRATVVLLRKHYDDMNERCVSNFHVPLGPDAFVFSDDPAGREPWGPATVSARWARHAARCGHPGVRLHDLRHFMASVLLAQGVALPVVSKRLGHSKVSTTADVYSHPLAGADVEAGEIMGNVLGP